MCFNCFMCMICDMSNVNFIYLLFSRNTSSSELMLYVTYIRHLIKLLYLYLYLYMYTSIYATYMTGHINKKKKTRILY